MKHLGSLASKNEKIVIGLMSGTSVDGIDAALVRITGNYTSTKVEEIAFENYPYPAGIKERVFRLFDTSTAKDICHMNFVLGELFAKAANDIAKKAGVKEIDLIGSHGQTIYHIPEPICTDYPLRSTMQIGEGAVIAHKTGVVTVSDFRVADMAAGGIGAPLVPYTEFLLYGNCSETIALQNIGGVGNITVIPHNATADKVIAFDTGPGNMIIDYMTQKTMNMEYDKNGAIGAIGKVNRLLIDKLMDDEYITKPPPKATGREYFGRGYCEKLYTTCKDMSMPDEDIIATVTAFTAQAISHAIDRFVPYSINKMIIGGGGAYNHTLLNQIRKRLPKIRVVTHEELHKNSDAKEAIAFAILANETISGNTGNLPSVTGAGHHKILGKISL